MGIDHGIDLLLEPASSGHLRNCSFGDLVADWYLLSHGHFYAIKSNLKDLFKSLPVSLDSLKTL